MFLLNRCGFALVVFCVCRCARGEARGSGREHRRVIDLGTLGGSIKAMPPQSARAAKSSSYSITLAGYGSWHAFSWPETGSMVDLGHPRRGAGATPRRSAWPRPGRWLRVLVIRLATGPWRAFWWTSTRGMIDLSTLGGSSSYAAAISPSGLIVGVSDTASGKQRAVLWQAP